jgi:hypothetical protein
VEAGKTKIILLEKDAPNLALSPKAISPSLYIVERIKNDFVGINFFFSQSVFGLVSEL